ncbi:uncharacterized protein [Macrobrachium rosenbergii]|uniref:uncharacterized protein n=1 Tax=Macrobrachium rosenbergii TaxID=79674 RepID=UPI0034D61BD6
MGELRCKRNGSFKKWDTLLSNLGGSLGLFLGVSLVSVVEVIELLVDVCGISFKSSRTRKVVPEDEEDSFGRKGTFSKVQLTNGWTEEDTSKYQDEGWRQDLKDELDKLKEELDNLRSLVRANEPSKSRRSIMQNGDEDPDLSRAFNMLFLNNGS